MKRLILILILPLLFTACNSVKKGNNNSEIERIANELVVENNIPGLNLSIIYKDGEQQNYSFAYADVQNKIELNSEHVLFSGSIGKTYAVAIIMQLAEAGKIHLEDKILNYFPENEWLDKLPNIHDITIEMLLQHTSGLPRYVFQEGFWDLVINFPDKVWTYEDRLAFVYNLEPVHEAGEGWGYSDTNYILLGMLIEKITGSYYYDEVKNRILIPQKLTTTYPAIKRKINNLSVGYSKPNELFSMPGAVVVDGECIFNPQFEWTGGGIACTTSDLAKWAKIYYESELFSKETLNQMVTPNKNGKLTDNLSYGMGSFIYNTKLGEMYGHSGTFPGYKSIFVYHPQLEIAIALQINCDYATEKMSLVEYLERILIDQLK
ncbi:MAG: serine hydrolase [Bacteroidales bacterium]|nr:serine hydrolase [Bacteroidales bacterium]